MVKVDWHFSQTHHLDYSNTYKVHQVSSPFPADSEGHQTGLGAGSDVHCLRGRHSWGEVCAILRLVHALTETHCRKRSAERAPAAPWQDHRVHQSDWPGCWQGEGMCTQCDQPIQVLSTDFTVSLCLRCLHVCSLLSVASSCQTPLPLCSCSSKPRQISMTWRMTILR